MDCFKARQNPELFLLGFFKYWGSAITFVSPILSENNQFSTNYNLLTLLKNSQWQWIDTEEPNGPNSIDSLVFRHVATAVEDNAASIALNPRLYNKKNALEGKIFIQTLTRALQFFFRHYRNRYNQWHQNCSNVV